MASTTVQATSGLSKSQWEASASLMRIDLPDGWRADNQPHTEDKWCPVCEWDGSWQSLLHRPQVQEEPRGNNEEPWVRSKQKSYARSSLDASAKAGNLCCAVLLAFSRTRWGSNDRPPSGSTSPTMGPPHAISRALFAGGVVGGSERPIRRLFAVSEAAGANPQELGIPSLSTDLYQSVVKASGMCSQYSSISWAKERINDCDEHHRECRDAYFSKFKPTRLVFVPPDAETNGVFLRHWSSVPQTPRYTALSHCWGPETSWPECQTTRGNYEQQLHGIPWARIPKTFADAMKVTRDLGVEYIWIDSLCIIQRDEKDWKEQSVRMHDVYSKAYVTLAAVDSPDSHGGFWYGQSPYWKIPELLLNFTWRGATYPLFLCSEPVHPTWGVVRGVRSEPWARPPLLTRAWAFQERMVSPRTIFFGMGGLVWDCHTQSEVQPDLLSELLRITCGPCHGPKQHFTQYCKPGTKANLSRLWDQLVSQYTRLGLSVSTDKLPGIAAIARSVRYSRPSDDYLCGLWRLSLAHGLLWERREPSQYNEIHPLPTDKVLQGVEEDDESKEDLMHRPYIGPSWSWVSSFDAVTFPMQSEDIATQKMEERGYSAGTQDNNYYGRISPGSHIIIRTSTLAYTWKPGPMNCMHGSRCWLRLFGAEGREIGDVCFKLDVQKWSTWDGDQETDAVLALIGLTKSGHARALVLHRFPDSENHQRIGVLVSPKDVMFEETCQRLARTFEEDGQVQTITLE